MVDPDAAAHVRSTFVCSRYAARLEYHIYAHDCYTFLHNRHRAVAT